MILASFSLPFDLPAVLKFGVIGLGAVMAVLAFWLLHVEQKKPRPRKQMLTSTYVFMGFSIVLMALGLLSTSRKHFGGGYVVPPEDKILVEKLPNNTYDDYLLRKDISIFDLRGWVPTDPADSNKKTSPANYINYLHLVKNKPIDKFVAHYSTSGAGIDLRCITHNYKLYEQKDSALRHKGEKSYGIEVDVADVPIGEEFLIIIEATYYNGFKNPLQESASTYTNRDTAGLEELSLIVLMPFEKPVKGDPVRLKGGENIAETTYRGNQKFYKDNNGRFIYWSIKDILPEMHYTLKWDW
jgi:hypothetical protein